jgi:hypothetical protein
VKNNCVECGAEHATSPFSWNRGQGRYCCRACADAGMRRAGRLPYQRKPARPSETATAAQEDTHP